MATFLAMPKLGLNMVDGVIVRWLVPEGTAVKAGQALLEIETDKATQEVEAPTNGFLASILKHEGEIVPCNVILAVLLQAGEAMPAVVPDVIAEGVAPKSEIEVKVQTGTVASTSANHTEGGSPVRIPTSPAARALANELGVDISKVIPRGNKISREDIETAYQQMQASRTDQPKVTKQEMSSIRRKIADHMSQSAQTVARVGLSLETDATALIEWRQTVNANGIKASYNVLFAKIVAQALVEFPYMNAQLDNNSICLMGDINIGIAVDSDRGLLVPVLHHANAKDVATLQKEFDGISVRALEGKNSLEELEGGTFTITNLGSLEIESFLPIINVPECAILGIGAIIKKPVVIEDQIVIRPRIALTLAFDHRLVDGAPAGRFLQRIKHLVENPIL
ncbi:MAG TPA: dihydrolipoamide acetyltransferase family protein [Anaerolineaceae bacterium]|nr:dihydrolipoamide acetyltransferase family protein [Anaerolineaceae bacterium]